MRNTVLRSLGLLLLPAFLSGPARAEDGITKDTILIGRSASMTGPIAARMKPPTEAMIAYFNAVNDAGGINGRRIKLINLDDGFDPKRAMENTKKLINEEKVFAMFAQVVGPTTKAVLPVIIEAQMPLIGTTSGSDALRQPPSKYVFHLKAGYGDEFAKMAEHLKTTGVDHVAIVYSDDFPGRESKGPAEVALKKQGITPAAVIGFKPGEAKAAVDQMVKADVQAVIMITVASAASEFYREYVKLPVRPQVFTWSITVVEGIYKEVGEKAYGLVVSQVVPSPNDKTYAVARDYQAMLKKNQLPDGGYAGIEGYISARVLVEALKRAGPAPTREKLIAALEAMRDYDLGGDFVSFAGPDHVGRHFVELAIVGRDGHFLH
jgi:branched-chain amino acid transport system substrate-binding protein